MLPSEVNLIDMKRPVDVNVGGNTSAPDSTARVGLLGSKPSWIVLAVDKQRIVGGHATMRHDTRSTHTPGHTKTLYTSRHDIAIRNTLKIGQHGALQLLQHTLLSHNQHQHYVQVVAALLRAKRREGYRNSLVRRRLQHNRAVHVAIVLPAWRRLQYRVPICARDTRG